MIGYNVSDRQDIFEQGGGNRLTSVSIACREPLDLKHCSDLMLEITPMSVLVQFLPDNITVEARVGEPVLEVAQRAGLFIPTGCLMGSCHACEVEVEGMGEICACITLVPPGRSHLTVNLFCDPTW